MVKSRAGLFLGLFAGAIGCAVPNPLFIVPDDGSGSGTAAATTDPTAATLDPTATTGVDPTATTGVDPTASAELCGNGIVEGIEQCDDGNKVEDDGCDNACIALFRAPQNIPGTPNSVAVVIADFSGDGINDVLLSHPADVCPLGCVRLYTNVGNATFNPAGELSTTGEARRLVVGEWDDKPGADFAYAAGGSAYLNAKMLPLGAIALPGIATTLVAAHIDGAGKHDLAMVSESADGINVALNDGSGFEQYTFVLERPGIQQLAVGDVNGDAVSDFVFTAEDDVDVGLFVDLSHDGAPEGPVDTETTSVSALTLGKFALTHPNASNAAFHGLNNGAGFLEIAVNDGAGAFAQYPDNVNASPSITKLLAARLNSVTDENIVALASPSVQVFTLVDGQVASSVTLKFQLALTDLDAGDLNGDGKIDLAIAGADNVQIMINKSPIQGP